MSTSAVVGTATLSPGAVIDLYAWSNGTPFVLTCPDGSSLAAGLGNAYAPRCEPITMSGDVIVTISSSQ